jgi:hypothetical protein
LGFHSNRNHSLSEKFVVVVGSGGGGGGGGGSGGGGGDGSGCGDIAAVTAVDDNNMMMSMMTVEDDNFQSVSLYVCIPNKRCTMEIKVAIDMTSCRENSSCRRLRRCR